ncbi:Putative ribonuclease H protein At1g65750 [Linum perenne]
MTYQCILDRLDSKLAGWKAKSLSLAGIVTLAHSALGAIPSYFMQISVIPIATCEEIDKRIRDFVWGSSDGERKTHLISWEQICKPKSMGGLGLRLARHLNTTFMAKFAFLFLQKSEALWVQVLQTKYFKKVDGSFRRRNNSSQSVVWKGISRAWQVMLEGARAGIGNGQYTLFWTGRWLDSGVRLIDKVVQNAELVDIEARVRDFISGDGSWNISQLRGFLSGNTIKEIIGMLPPNEERGEDTWIWGLECNGKFLIRSAYEIVVRPSNPRPEAAWDLVWRWEGPSRIQHFLWLVGHEKLLTNLERKRRHISNDSSCPCCEHPEESILHILRDCNMAAQVWDLLKLPTDDVLRSGCDMDQWLRGLLKHSRSLELGIMSWYLWKARNDLDL